MDADVVALQSGRFTGALAADERDLTFEDLRFGAHDAADLDRDRSAADGADVDRRFAGDDRRGSRVAACVAACAAVVAGQAFADLRFTLVDRHMELLARKDEPRADDDADDGDDGGGDQNDNGCAHCPTPFNATSMTG